MLINQNTKIKCKNVLLIPYRKEHVLKYHEWMKSEELQRLTVSNPLTLEEEYEMQQSWIYDFNKCTFIILDRKKYEATNNEVESMIGDANLYFLDVDSSFVAEFEIMIAEKWARGQHLGWEAAISFMLYAVEKLNVKQFMVKVLEENFASIKMFEKLGFIKTGYSSIFKEVTMDKIVDEEWLQFLRNELSEYSEGDYKPDEKETV